MVGLNKVDEKYKRQQRRKNHIARDLRTPKYRERVLPDKKKTYNKPKYWDEEEDE